MKKLRYIPLLALTAVLASCGLNVKAPSFAEEGEEVSFVKFKEGLIKAESLSEITDIDYNLGDKVMKFSTSDTTIRTWKRGNKELAKQESQYVGKGESQYDVDNYVAKFVSEAKNTITITSQEGSSNQTSNQSYERYYQIESVKGSNCFVQVNAKTKNYFVTDKITSLNKRGDIFDNIVRGDMASIITQFEGQIPYDQKSSKGYLFYNSDDIIFTIILNGETEDTSTSTYKLRTQSKIKAQLDLTDKKEAFRLSYEVTHEYTYKTDYDNYASGDVVTEKTTEYMDTTISEKNVDLNNVDLGDYILLDYAI